MEVKFIDSVKGSGVFTKEFIAEGTLLWVPTLVKKYSLEEVLLYLSGETDREQSAIWLRQAFVLESEPEYLCTNVEDEGRFVNHSSDPNTGFASTERPLSHSEILQWERNLLVTTMDWVVRSGIEICALHMEYCQPMKLLESFLVETCICIVV